MTTLPQKVSNYIGFSLWQKLKLCRYFRRQLVFPITGLVCSQKLGYWEYDPIFTRDQNTLPFSLLRSITLRTTYAATQVPAPLIF